MWFLKLIVFADAVLDACLTAGVMICISKLSGMIHPYYLYILMSMMSLVIMIKYLSPSHRMRSLADGDDDATAADWASLVVDIICCLVLAINAAILLYQLFNHLYMHA